MLFLAIGMIAYGQEEKKETIDSLSLELQYLEDQIEKFSDLLDAKVAELEKVDVDESLKATRKKIDESIERIKVYRKELAEDYPALSQKQKELLKESGEAMKESMSALGAALEIWTAQIAEGWQKFIED